MIKRVKNPISLARRMLSHPHHCYLMGSAAEKFAQLHGLDLVENTYFTTERRLDQLRRAKEAEAVSLTCGSIVLLLFGIWINILVCNGW